MLIKHVGDISKKLLNLKIEQGMTAVDCTIGNGHDTLYLKKRVGLEGKVYGFDIQEVALENTKKKLQSNDLFENVKLFLVGHEKIDQYVTEGVDIILYNLGYLPRADKSITTRWDTTIKSIEKALALLNKGGVIAITTYPGHVEGEEELVQLNRFFKKLRQKEYNVLKMNFINQANKPPVQFMIEKK